MKTQGVEWNAAGTDTTDLHRCKAAAVKSWTLLSINFSGGRGGDMQSIQYTPRPIPNFSLTFHIFPNSLSGDDENKLRERV